MARSRHYDGGGHVYMELNMGLTKAQSELLNRTRVKPTDGEPFIVLYDARDDCVAKNLAAKGLGSFVSNGWRYSWRKRDGYTNNFYISEKGMQERR